MSKILYNIRLKIKETKKQKTKMRLFDALKVGGLDIIIMENQKVIPPEFCLHVLVIHVGGYN